MAGVLCREARDAELSAQAAVQAEALFGDNSLVVADLRYFESNSLASLAYAASGAEEAALLSRSCAVLVSLIKLLERRLADNTLLPGTMREEEVDYAAHAQAAVFKARNEPVPPSFVLRAKVYDGIRDSRKCHNKEPGLIAASVLADGAEEDGGVVCAPRTGRHPSNSRHTCKPDKMRRSACGEN